MLQQPRLGWVTASSIPLFEDKSCPCLWGSIMFFYQCFLRGNFIFGKTSLFPWPFCCCNVTNKSYTLQHTQIRKLNIFPEMVINTLKCPSKVFGCLWASFCPAQETNHGIGWKFRVLHVQSVRVASKWGSALSWLAEIGYFSSYL